MSESKHQSLAAGYEPSAMWRRALPDAERRVRDWTRPQTDARARLDAVLLASVSEADRSIRQTASSDRLCADISYAHDLNYREWMRSARQDREVGLRACRGRVVDHFRVGKRQERPRPHL